MCDFLDIEERTLKMASTNFRDSTLIFKEIEDSKLLICTAPQIFGGGTASRAYLFQHLMFQKNSWSVYIEQDVIYSKTC